MIETVEQSLAAAALRHALPYIRLFRGRTFVVKAGGGVVEDDTAVRGLVEQVGLLHHVGIRTVLVHGGGAEASELSRALGAEPRFVAGRRVTDERALAAAVMALNGTVNTRLLAAGRALDLPLVGISGVDSGLIRARRRPPAPGDDGVEVDYGCVGDVEAVDAALVEQLLAAGRMPVVSPLAADGRGALLNVNADTVAAALAAALGAEKLILATGARGILERPDDPGSLVSYTDLEGLERLRRAGALTDGMLPKAAAVAAALRGGVARVHLVSYRLPDSLLLEVFTNEGCGTLVVADASARPG